jgi:hypothetical protein
MDYEERVPVFENELIAVCLLATQWINQSVLFALYECSSWLEKISAISEAPPFPIEITFFPASGVVDPNTGLVAWAWARSPKLSSCTGQGLEIPREKNLEAMARAEEAAQTRWVPLRAILY